jgi:hypothetical protein
MVKYGEIKALLSGITTIQGTSPDNACEIDPDGSEFWSFSYPPGARMGSPSPMRRVGGALPTRMAYFSK